jgi:hypothetical protein
MLSPTHLLAYTTHEQGHAIQALAHGNATKFMESKTEVMSCYRIQDYVCSAPNQFFNVVKHPVLLRVGPAATITPIPCTDDFPKNYFEILEYEKLHTICGQKNEVTG